MCGICGYINKKGKYPETLINDMLNLIHHRGPDDYGIFHDELITLGHRRLAILDTSSDGKQPMKSNNTTVITYNGEIYNYLELKRELIEKGYSFKTKTDTEVLLAAYDYWGINCVNHFNGMWAFTIWDKEKHLLFCSRDRFGIKPFYFCESKELFAFASEIKQLLITTKNPPKANLTNLIVYLTNGTIDYSNETMFIGIQQLPGGHNLLFNTDTMKYTVEQWYDLKQISPSKREQTEDNQIFSELFRDSVKLRLNADVPVGSCLSGGMDSSAIVCCANQFLNEIGHSGHQHTVSSCSADKAYDEQEYIDDVVKHTDVHSHKIYPDMNHFFDELNEVIWHMDEPFGSTSIYAQWNVFKEAKKQGLTVMLDGQGADEQLGGYTGFYSIYFTNLLRKRKFKKLFHEINQFQQLRVGSESTSIPLIFVKTIVNALLPFSLRLWLADFFHTKLTEGPFPDNFYRNNDIYKIKKAHNERDEYQFIYACMHTGLAALLHYEDRNSMAHSIESRVPFLDYRLVNEVYSMPLGHKIKDGKTKYILREGLKDLLPEKTYNRYSKLAFATPEDKWYRDNTELIRNELDLACDILTGLLNKKQVLAWYDKNISEMKYGDFRVFRIICAAHWVSVFHVDLC